MSGDNLEARVAALETKFTFLDRAGERVLNQQDEILKLLRDIQNSQSDMGNRLDSLEKEMTKAQPTIQEFVTVKTEIKAAGKMGKIAWAVGSSLITMLAGIAALMTTFKQQFAQWLLGGS